MEVILLRDVKGVGRRGELASVSEGFARNFLIPKKQALLADEAAKRDYQITAKSARLCAERTAADARKMSQRLQGETLEFERPGSSAGTLYASLKENEIRAKLIAQYPALPKTAKIRLQSPVKTAGAAEATVEILPGISAKIKVIVKSANAKTA